MVVSWGIKGMTTEGMMMAKLSIISAVSHTALLAPLTLNSTLHAAHTNATQGINMAMQIHIVAKKPSAMPHVEMNWPYSPKNNAS